MIQALRERFNREFTPARYAAYVAGLERRCGSPIPFRLSETPCFLPDDLLGSMIKASHDLVAQLLESGDYRAAADAAVPPAFRLPRGETLPTYLQIDFGLVEVMRGGQRVIEPRLVELQAFPSLYAFQLAMGDASADSYGLSGVTPLLGDLTRDQYLALMGRALLNGHDPAEVVLMEIDPVRQKTWPDFALTEQLWGIRAIDVRDVICDGNRLMYRRDGALTRIARIYNRVIPDELERLAVELPFDYRDDLDVEWTGGPDWFFRISKFSLPWLHHPWVPHTQFLNDVAVLPPDRGNWLLKPLFSFAGGGIIFDPSDADVAAIPARDRQLYVLQERVEFTPVIDTPHGPTKIEVRIMLVRDGDIYRAVLPLVRMGRGKMMGVDFNKGQAWVGASAGLAIA